jgi:3-oxoacyl-(acyl-carrier-protein) synthase
MNKLKESISITAFSSISALGSDSDTVFKAYQNSNHFLTQKRIGDQRVWVGTLPMEEEEAIHHLRQSDSKYRNLDDSVLYGLYVARKAIAQAKWGKGETFGINMGSSRGATTLFEDYHEKFLANGKASTLTSPTTTLGNISSWVAHDLQSQGPIISHSITCSTALHAILNGVAWIQGGLADKFLVGGSEAPLTAFTVAQMQALKIYASMGVATTRGVEKDFPCRAFDLAKNRNTMVLGEGAGMACLEKGNSKHAFAKIVGMGYATEILQHNVSISADAQCFQESMKMALGTIAPEDVDVIVMHAPGTLKGDSSEVAAIKKVFAKSLPFLTTNKWKLGHTFGASGMLSIEMAILMLIHQEFLPVPFVTYRSFPKKIDSILVNAVGFGGNAVSILLSR